MSLSTSKPLEIKASLIPVMILHLLDIDEQSLLSSLENKIQRAPNLFINANIIIDVTAVATGQVPLTAIVQLMREHGLVPVGIRGANQELQAVATQLALGIFPQSGEIQKPKATNLHKQPKQAIPLKVITQPVRSGQQVVYLEGDLVIMSSVSPGAEVLAAGNIHIYGTLRGKALAGVNGDITARIFCQQLDAEIVSIAGNYQVNEELTDELRGKTTQIYLEHNKLMIQVLPNLTTLKR
jgi:septum site-determining protein MinC